MKIAIHFEEGWTRAPQHGYFKIQVLGWQYWRWWYSTLLLNCGYLVHELTLCLARIKSFPKRSFSLPQNMQICSSNSFKSLSSQFQQEMIYKDLSNCVFPISKLFPQMWWHLSMKLSKKSALKAWFWTWVSVPTTNVDYHMCLWKFIVFSSFMPQWVEHLTYHTCCYNFLLASFIVFYQLCYITFFGVHTNYTTCDIECHMVLNPTMVTFRMTLLIDKCTNILMDDGWVHPLAKTLPFACQ